MYEDFIAKKRCHILHDTLVICVVMTELKLLVALKSAFPVIPLCGNQDEVILPPDPETGSHITWEGIVCVLFYDWKPCL